VHNRNLFRIFGDLARDFGQPSMVWQAATLIGALVLAWMVARMVRMRLDAYRANRFAALGVDAVTLNKLLFPLLGWVFVALARLVLDNAMRTPLLDLALVPLFGIALIYVMLYLVRRVFGSSGHVHGLLWLFERVVSIAVWIAMALKVAGIQDDILDWMASVRFHVATAHLTLLSLSTGLLWVMVTLVVALAAATALEDRLMRATTLDANLRVVLARVGRALLILAAVLISLSLVGIDVTVLGVFGGALGVGLGFGLQKIASNYVSGFIILLDRSLRLGDMISVGGLQGIVTQIRTRYTVVRGLDGIETLIPNERLVADVVQNHSSYLTRGYAKLAVQAAYDSDVELALRLLVEATRGVERVLQEPAPASYLVGFGADGLNLEVGFWIEEAATGTAAVRSRVNRRIWSLFSEHGIAIPFTQREVRIVGDVAPLSASLSAVGQHGVVSSTVASTDAGADAFHAASISR
jgi:small-conductance mechanosensitive channel